MPDMDGLGVLKALKAPQAERTPEVILVTAYASKETALAAMTVSYTHLTLPTSDLV